MFILPHLHKKENYTNIKIKDIWEWETLPRLMVAAQRPPKKKQINKNNLLSYNLGINKVYEKTI